ncbi:YheU family protein [Candidatus Berkiella cookevillensis]|uniref:YheU family protein n=1 Tax=Candidatus Berkiella cookevillensis TaxID=437022 RepID=A0A0Q9YP04_9GAMM|nr:YheU family protein [Candidatus Berkiella cookevillensis]MCS5709306.1 YheU family protein [Candidatus Berkiella cookevillensis]
MAIDIPYQEIPEATLICMLEEFVTREGTNYGEKEFLLDELVEQLKQQLISHRAMIQYDEISETFNIVSTENQSYQK